MVCPRCGGPMSTFDRAGVQVDQCANCRGIFLDRGEIERLVEAESSYYNAPAPAPQAPPPGYAQPGYPQPGYPPAGYPPPGYYDDEHHGGHHGRRRSMFHDLFDD
ncbi:MAG: zf-TFIIB domain-containing protein [Actinobacteria bacterium]|nr:zf-TFIIB domain-containing protein [Actinomycetota bacterium]